MGAVVEKLGQQSVFEADDVGSAAIKPKLEISLEQVQRGERVLGQLDIVGADYVIKTLQSGSNEDIYTLIQQTEGGYRTVFAIAAFLDNKAIGKEADSYCLRNLQRAWNA